MDYIGTLKHCLKELLFKWDGIAKKKILDECLRYVCEIYCGFSIDKKMRTNGYWYFECRSGKKFYLVKGNYEVERVDNKLARKIMEEIWNDFKSNKAQLSLFE